MRSGGAAGGSGAVPVSIRTSGSMLVAGLAAAAPGSMAPAREMPVSSTKVRLLTGSVPSWRRVGVGWGSAPFSFPEGRPSLRYSSSYRSDGRWSPRSQARIIRTRPSWAAMGSSAARRSRRASSGTSHPRDRRHSRSSPPLVTAIAGTFASPSHREHGHAPGYSRMLPVVTIPRQRATGELDPPGPYGIARRRPPWNGRQNPASAGERCRAVGDEVPRHGGHRPRRRPQGGMRVAR